MENADTMENIPEFYNNEDSLMNFDQSRCGFDNITVQQPEHLPSNYEERCYNLSDANTFIDAEFFQNANNFLCGTTDDIETTKAVFQHLDMMLRQQVDTEIEVFKENIDRVLTDQQLQFKQAFGLQDQAVTMEAIHVVPQSGNEEEVISVSEESRMAADKTDSSDSEECAERLQSWYHQESYPPEQTSEGQEMLCTCSHNQEEVLILKYLTRMLTADAAITATLRRKEYAS